MTDREKVIKGLEELEGFLFKEYANIKAEESKIYYDRFKSLSDAIALLKEQEETSQELARDYQRKLDNATEALVNATKIIKSQPDVVRCKDCKFASMFETEDGQTIYECGSATDFHKPDWFCADGESKN